jgi:hypothetical protein
LLAPFIYINKIAKKVAKKKKKGIASRSASLFVKPYRNSVTRREEFQASAVGKTIELITPVGRALAVTAGRTV